LNWTRLPPATSSTARKIDDGEALGRLLPRSARPASGDLAQLLDHPVLGQLSALGALCPSLFDRRGDVSFVIFWQPTTRARAFSIAAAMLAFVIFLQRNWVPLWKLVDALLEGTHNDARMWP
jgi:hypothetical protein